MVGVRVPSESAQYNSIAMLQIQLVFERVKLEVKIRSVSLWVSACHVATFMAPHPVLWVVYQSYVG
jgi:hypothetical protein